MIRWQQKNRLRKRFFCCCLFDRNIWILHLNAQHVISALCGLFHWNTENKRRRLMTVRAAWNHEICSFHCKQPPLLLEICLTDWGRDVRRNINKQKKHDGTAPCYKHFFFFLEKIWCQVAQSAARMHLNTLLKSRIYILSSIFGRSGGTEGTHQLTATEMGRILYSLKNAACFSSSPPLRWDGCHC